MLQSFLLAGGHRTEPSEITVVTQVGQLDLHCDRVVLESGDVVHIRLPFGVGQQPQHLHGLRRKSFCRQRLQRPIGVLHHIVEQRRHGGNFIVHLFRQVERMEHIGHPALVHLAVVRFIGQLHGFFRPFGIDHPVSLLCFPLLYRLGVGIARNVVSKNRGS